MTFNPVHPHHGARAGHMSPVTPTPGKGPLAPDDTFQCRVGDWQAMCDDFDATAAERDRFQAENAALVAALREAVEYHSRYGDEYAWLDQARAALAAHAAREVKP